MQPTTPSYPCTSKPGVNKNALYNKHNSPRQQRNSDCKYNKGKEIKLSPIFLGNIHMQRMLSCLIQLRSLLTSVVDRVQHIKVTSKQPITPVHGRRQMSLLAVPEQYHCYILAECISEWVNTCDQSYCVFLL
jgi:hypothetical protein